MTTFKGLLRQYPGLRDYAARLKPLANSPADLEALSALLASAKESGRVSVMDLGAALPELREAAGAATLAEACELVQGLIDDRQYLGSITAGFWQDSLRKVAAALPAGMPGRMQWLAKLNRYAEPLPPGIGWIAAPEDAARAHAGLAGVVEQSYGYSDRDIDLKRELPGLFQCAAHLVHSVDDFELLCAAMPGLLRSLPEESQETPIGYIHTYDVSAVERHAREAGDLAQFLAACGA